ncbi:SRPBCC family protein [Alloscardovia macacae]|uniref:Polyketide cyclase n=1 Tax=Alloscardovia macacae TaxID=1160091 RepID=A0A261F6S8_9BIFI|nr:SRPBCC family protein [Alloscardovia macacae]OZG54842.1 hypothetical protein ALMA_0167 [Alloscardovia macacae]
MTAVTVAIQDDICTPREEVFTWFYHSENFAHAPLVFRSTWATDTQHEAGSERDILMVAGWYHEEITAVDPGHTIHYRVTKSFPSVRQDFTEVLFESICEDITRVTWTIEVDVPTPWKQTALSQAAGTMARLLYRSILRQGKKELE